MTYGIGLIGGMGSGKSTVADYFMQLGVTYLSADQIARQLTRQGQPAFKKISAFFGQNILTPEGELDRRQLRLLIAKNETKKIWLEQLLHPLIRQELEQRMSQAKGPYCLVEIPLLTSKQQYPYLKRILYVHADQAHKIQRIMARDQCSIAEAQAMLNIQINESVQRALADDIIVNTGSLEELYQQVLALHQRYTRCCAE